jgi:hypothetical protein
VKFLGYVGAGWRACLQSPSDVILKPFSSEMQAASGASRLQWDVGDSGKIKNAPTCVYRGFVNCS